MVDGLGCTARLEKEMDPLFGDRVTLAREVST